MLVSQEQYIIDIEILQLAARGAIPYHQQFILQTVLVSRAAALSAHQILFRRCAHIEQQYALRAVKIT